MRSHLRSRPSCLIISSCNHSSGRLAEVTWLRWKAHHAQQPGNPQQAPLKCTADVQQWERQGWGDRGHTALVPNLCHTLADLVLCPSSLQGRQTNKLGTWYVSATKVLQSNLDNETSYNRNPPSQPSTHPHPMLPLKTRRCFWLYTMG